MERGVYVFIACYGFQQEQGEEVSSNDEVMASLLEKAADNETEEDWEGGNSKSSSSSLSENVTVQSSSDEEESQLFNFGAVKPESAISEALIMNSECFLCFEMMGVIECMLF